MHKASRTARGEPPHAGPGARRGGGCWIAEPPHEAVRSIPVLLAGGSAWGLRTGDKEFRQRVFSH